MHLFYSLLTKYFVSLSCLLMWQIQPHFYKFSNQKQTIFLFSTWILLISNKFQYFQRKPYYIRGSSHENNRYFQHFIEKLLLFFQDRLFCIKTIHNFFMNGSSITRFNWIQVRYVGIVLRQSLDNQSTFDLRKFASILIREKSRTFSKPIVAEHDPCEI